MYKCGEIIFRRPKACCQAVMPEEEEEEEVEEEEEEKRRKKKKGGGGRRKEEEEEEKEDECVALLGECGRFVFMVGQFEGKTQLVQCFCSCAVTFFIVKLL